MSHGRRDFLSLIEEVHRVQVPLLQRDYAQGRLVTESAEVRKRFVEALVDALSDSAPSSGLDLDFVYGRTRPMSPGAALDTHLEPLDGQQRLTTLFLLHWYAACAAGEIPDFQRRLRDSRGGSRFTYRTRPAAKELFDGLIREKAPDPVVFKAPERQPSGWLQDQPWFARGWLRDPTVQGCLTMLDVLHDRLHGDPSTYQKLLSRDPRRIHFRLLALEHFDLGDDLYIKMNARGKPLTAFEVWKAQVERYVAEQSKHSLSPRPDGQSWHAYISGRFDGAWADFLWRRPLDEDHSTLDDRFMHLVRAAALVSRVIVSIQADVDIERLTEQIDELRRVPQPSFLVLQELDCVDPCFVETLTRLLDTLVERGSPTFLERTDYLDEGALFERVLLAKPEREAGGLTLVDLVKLQAWCAFLLARPADLGTSAGRRSLDHWTRVVCNLANNSDLDDLDSAVAALRGVQRSSEHASASDLLERIAAGKLDFEGFNRAQREEEQLKAALILRDAGWRQLIERAECHSYFQGDIGFLLRFSGIWERWGAAKQCDWTDPEDERFRSDFESWYRKASAVLLSATALAPDFLWERALLSTGDYLLRRGVNWSLLDAKHRNASWKRLLRADTKLDDREARRDVVRRVLERVDPDDVRGSLERVIADGVHDATGADDWRAVLVREPRHIAYCERRNLRWPDDSTPNHVILLQRERLSGSHTDLHLHDLWLRLSAPNAGGPWAPTPRPEVAGENPLRLDLEAPAHNVRLTVERPSEELMLALVIQDDEQLAQSLGAEWGRDAEGVFRQTAATVAAAETAILQLTEVLRAGGQPGGPV